MTEPNTHLQIDRGLCGEPITIEDGSATVKLTPTDAMKVDDRGLIHGGFIFGLVDYAAMLAVNDPHVVLGAADVRFTAPVRVGDEVIATATRAHQKDRKHLLEVKAHVGDTKVFSGTMTAFVLDHHVLDAG